ncbi:MAG: sugar ABC transporter permease [Christensenellaceae bacterium]|nr:sugar ABC transporter permease [Christensenellaceae bacterium]
MKRSKVWDFLFLFPTVFAFIMVILVPFGLGIYYSLTDWNGVRDTMNFVGFENYVGMFQEKQFQFSFIITVLYTFINVALVNLVGFTLALLATSKIKLKNLYRAGFFVPNLIGGIVLGYIWQFMFNNLFTAVFSAKSLLASPSTVIWAMSIVNTWQYGGYIMMIYVAALQAIPDDVLEAAEVDGATYMIRLRKILIPMMANSFTITLFLTLTNSFKQYDMNFTLTNGGPATFFSGSVVKSSQLLAMDIYNTANNANKLALAQSKAVVFFIILVVFSLIQVTLNRRKEIEA